jgi:hypothetical protein
MNGPKNLDALVIGGTGTSATLIYLNGGVQAQWNVTTGIQVKSGSSMEWDDPVDLDAGFIQVDGTWRADFPGRVGTFGGDSIRSGGTIDVNRSGLVVGAEEFHNSGTLQLTGSAARLTVVGGEFGHVAMEGGTVSGQGTVVVTTVLPPLLPPPTNYSPPVFIWSGGTIPVRLTGTGARLEVIGIPVILGSSSLQGLIQLQTVRIQVLGFSYATPVATTDGELPSGVQLDITGNGEAILPHRNLGTIAVSATDSMTLWFDDVGIVRSPDSLTNAGTFVVNAGTGSVMLQADSVVNSGTLTLDGAFDLTTAKLIRNSGVIAVNAARSLALNNAHFLSEVGAVQTGPLQLTGGLLSGVGQVGNVATFGTQIEPGGVALSGLPGAGIGVLTAASLIFNATSSLGLDLAGLNPGSHDELVVSGQVIYAGTLSLREKLSFAGGSCGQLMTLISDGGVAAARGAFGAITGLIPAPGRGWRLYNPTGSLQLVGHDPNLAVSRSPAQATVTEGGAGASYDVCLRAAPAAAVTVTPAAVGGQLAAPAPIQFTPAAWALPQAVAIGAVNDLLVEPPPQTASVTHVVGSADPAYNGARPGVVTVTIVDNDGSTNLELSVVNAPPVVAAGAQFTLSLKEFNLGPEVSVGATFTVPASAGFAYHRYPRLHLRCDRRHDLPAGKPGERGERQLHGDLPGGDGRSVRHELQPDHHPDRPEPRQ